VCLLVLAATIPLSSCGGNGERAPTELMDGSPVREAPVELEGVDVPTVLTKVLSRAAVDKPGTDSRSCLRGRSTGMDAAGRSIERVGVSSESVTFRDSSGRGVFGCDNSLGPREENRRWCGRAYGVLYSGRLRDPRLSIGCQTRDETPMGFVWIEPEPSAMYLVVEQPGYAEVYAVAGELPVRVATTSGVEIEGSRASFDLREHAPDGRLLRAYRLEAAVAG
jgi:hypothetical protein